MSPASLISPPPRPVRPSAAWLSQATRKNRPPVTRHPATGRSTWLSTRQLTGQAGAVNGALTVMCGGDTPAYKSAEPLIECYSRMRRLLGPSGSGQLAKMVNQIAIAGLDDWSEQEQESADGDRADHGASCLFGPAKPSCTSSIRESSSNFCCSGGLPPT